MQGLASQHDAFTPTFAREALITLRDLGRGAIFVTSGLRDLRLVRDGESLSLEAVGLTLPRPGDGRDLVRAFLCALFWEDPSVTVDPAGATRPPAAAAIRLTKGAAETLEQLEQGVAELEPLREQVPGIDVSVSVTGAPPPPGEDSPTAKLFRALMGQPAGALGAAAEKLGLDAIDAAWAVADLLEVKQAVVKRPPPTVAVRRLKRAELLVDESLLPAMRLAHVGRGLARIEPKHSAVMLQLAGEVFLQVDLPEHALFCLRQAVTGAPESIAAREALLGALVAANRTAEATTARAELARLYAELRLWRRARAHLEALPERTPDQRAALLDARLASRDFPAAAELAAELAPTWPDERRLELAERFVRAGAADAPLQTAVEVSGLYRLRPVRRLAVVGCVLAIILAAALATELELRTQFLAASRLSREHLDAGRDEEASAAFDPLASLAERAGATRWPFTCLGTIGAVRAELADVAADRKLLAAEKATLVWQAAPDTRRAEQDLADLLRRVRSQPLRNLVTRTQGALAEYRAAATRAVEHMQAQTFAGRSDEALGAAREIAATYGNARDLWATPDRNVEVHLDVLPKEANVTWRGQLVTPLVRDGGRFTLLVPLDGTPCALEVSQPNHVTQRREVRFADLLTANLRVELVRLVQDPALPWPEAPATPKLHVLDDARGVQLARQHLRPDVVFESSEAPFAPLAGQIGAGHRLIVLLRSDVVSVGRKRIVLNSVSLFLDEPSTGRKAKPMTIELDHLDRPVADQDGKLTIAGIARVEKLPLILDAAREAVTKLREELP